MKVFLIALTVALSVYGILYLLLLILSKKPFKYFMVNAICGWWAFALVNLTGFLTGLHISVNLFTVIVSAILGIPGTAFITIMKYCIFV